MARKEIESKVKSPGVVVLFLVIGASIGILSSFLDFYAYYYAKAVMLVVAGIFIGMGVSFALVLPPKKRGA